MEFLKAPPPPSPLDFGTKFFGQSLNGVHICLGPIWPGSYHRRLGKLGRGGKRRASVFTYRSNCVLKGAKFSLSNPHLLKPELTLKKNNNISLCKKRPKGPFNGGAWKKFHLLWNFSWKLLTKPIILLFSSLLGSYFEKIINKSIRSVHWKKYSSNDSRLKSSWCLQKRPLSSRRALVVT